MALLGLPGSEESKIKKSLTSPADCIVYDLEDSVAPNRKGAARELVFDALKLKSETGPELAVRINAVGSGIEFDDLNVILQSPHLDTILIPKVQSARDIDFVCRLIELIGHERSQPHVRIIASIENALGILSLKEIATASPQRVDALLFAAEDFCADMGLHRSPAKTEMLYARSAVATTAHAYGLQAIDLVCMDFRNPEVLVKECVNGRDMGFTGKQAIHPNQIETIQNTFMPSEDQIQRAKKIIAGYEISEREGKGAYGLDGLAIDLPVYKWALKIMQRAGTPHIHAGSH
ncbi:Pyruvate/Phosphoenolpyruvate kinase-like domain-containing protein [Dimargaris cristalligena]|uniref:Pyruvate/Phosphoenolpyruvate kinase-like domain-containing protein n=1 Tax=Dimargaris cristalligena TaxID=215637 RepID=A0A4P9ZVY6_9FUNG|nr:Pyruvate/Phosphoenolpyruvate kinase-like domain-containing protein [Dimargaris cristalligena]|eukprot:RKP37785.1 Pyruvate/Phosphoenolpyruvate kinase-like domain-containing protein [Dimargaris cristalligena]